MSNANAKVFQLKIGKFTALLLKYSRSFRVVVILDGTGKRGQSMSILIPPHPRQLAIESSTPAEAFAEVADRYPVLSCVRHKLSFEFYRLTPLNDLK